MPLISCKVNLKLTLTKRWVLVSADVENDCADSNNITFTIKYTKSYVLVVTLLTKYHKKQSKLLSKVF